MNGQRQRTGRPLAPGRGPMRTAALRFRRPRQGVRHKLLLVKPRVGRPGLDPLAHPWFVRPVSRPLIRQRGLRPGRCPYRYSNLSGRTHRPSVCPVVLCAVGHDAASSTPARGAPTCRNGGRTGHGARPPPRTTTRPGQPSAHQHTVALTRPRTARHAGCGCSTTGSSLNPEVVWVDGRSGWS